MNGFSGFVRLDTSVVVAGVLLIDVDRVVAEVAKVDGVAGDAVNDLKLASGGTSRQHEG